MDLMLRLKHEMSSPASFDKMFKKMRGTPGLYDLICCISHLTTTSFVPFHLNTKLFPCRRLGSNTLSVWNCLQFKGASKS